MMDMHKGYEPDFRSTHVGTGTMMRLLLGALVLLLIAISVSAGR